MSQARRAILSSSERMNVYRQIFLLNRSFHFAVQRLEELTETRIFNPKYLKEIIGLTQEAQLEANTYLLSPLQSVELDDHALFGKVRIALEKRLKQGL